jgi:hypothetical protein
MMKSLCIALVVGCGSTVPEMAETRIVIHAKQPPVVTPIVVEEPPKPGVFPPEIRSVEFKQITILRKEPRLDSAKVGVIRKHARVAVAKAITGEGCKDGRWLLIVPRGWTCESAIEPSREVPTATVAASLNTIDEGPLVPGVYAAVRGADVSTSVRIAGPATVDGERYWRTTGGDLVPASSVIQFSPSKFRGVALGAKAALPAWLRGRSDPYKPVRTFKSPNGRVSGELAARTVVSILEESSDGRFVRVTETAWVRRTDVRVASIATPPPGTGANEKWFDVDRDEQVLVAYEGERPVYATLVSTGKWEHATPTITSRVSSKLQTASMNNDRGLAKNKYAVADVPWTMYYDNSYALHTSYWHDGFGGPRSHGCINLAPRDARLLYDWSSPDVPAGWIAVYGDEDNPGSLVRVRSKETPDPAFRGYAKRMHGRGMVASSN